MIQLVWLVPLIPLVGFILIGTNYKRLSVKLSGWIASSAILLSFFVSLGIFIELTSGTAPQNVVLFNWINTGSFHLSMEFMVDSLSSLMMLIVTGISFLIHVYSIGYMKDDKGFNRFFAYLNLFVFFMLLLILGGNYAVMFIGWEGVGLSSYLLIGFWFTNTSYNNAAKKAFIMNRIGDLGFLMGMFLIYTTFGSLNFTEVFAKGALMSSGSVVLTAITLLLFVGAMGKSSQIPLFTWLPDAMAGPTPVSALIHAATMVTAGVYMVARSNVLYILAPFTMHFVLIIGLITALVAGIIAIRQNDIKKVLAYSTVSQLGIMFMGLGAGAFSSAVFHLTTHAFFKALLFLAAGSVIHALGGEQDIRKMGGLKEKIKITWLVFFAGTIAISGIPPFSGFFSKDEILSALFHVSPVYWAIGVLISLLTAFYMFRLFFLTFYGSFRGDSHTESHIHESPKVMTFPLIVLAILSVFGGVLNLPEYFAKGGIRNFLNPIFEASGKLVAHVETASFGTEMGLIGITLVLIVIMILLARRMFIGKLEISTLNDSKPFSLKGIIEHKFYIDELYEWTFEKPTMWLSDKFHKVVEKKIIDGFVEFIGKSTLWSGEKLRHLQTGNVGFYLFAIVVGIVAVLFYSLLS